MPVETLTQDEVAELLSPSWIQLLHTVTLSNDNNANDAMPFDSDN